MTFSLAIIRSSFSRKYEVSYVINYALLYRDSDSLLAVLNQFCSWMAIGKYSGMSLPVNRPGQMEPRWTLFLICHPGCLHRRSGGGRVTRQPPRGVPRRELFV